MKTGVDFRHRVQFRGELDRQPDAAVACRSAGVVTGVERDPVLVDPLHERHRCIVVFLRAIERPLLENRENADKRFLKSPLSTNWAGTLSWNAPLVD